MKYDQNEHKDFYGIPRAARLKGFVIVNEEKDDMLALIQDFDKDIALFSAYTKNPADAVLFKNIECAVGVIEKIAKPLLVSAVYTTKKDLMVAALFQYTPERFS
jgi:hypothetical protein